MISLYKINIYNRYLHRYPWISAYPQFLIRHLKLISGYLYIRTDIRILYPRIGPLITGKLAEYAAKKYKSHRCIPDYVLAELNK